MSDIYLQITETPTVVTLSAPVVSGALASTVTVANTVTVALDANSLSALENVTVTVGAAITISNFPSSQAVTFSNLALTDTQLRASAVTIGGTVTANLYGAFLNTSGGYQPVQFSTGLPVANEKDGMTFNPIPFLVEGSVTVGSALPAGTNRIGVVTIGGGTVTIGAGTAQIGSVTASISGTVPISISSVTVGVLPDLTTSTDFEQAGTQIAVGITNYGSIPVAILAGTAQIGSVTASISNSLTIGSLPAISGTVTANTFAVQGTAVTTSNFTSTTASTVLASFNATREVLTIFNEGAGNLHICAGATCTTIAYQVRLSAGDYYEVPNHQTTITHSAVFATAGTARICQVS
jgi:fibronectin-binding autotransporter adhesin